MTDHRRSSAPLPSARGDGSCPTGRAADGPVSAGGVGAVRGPRVEPVIIRPVQPGHRIRSTLGAALVCTLIGAAALVTACSASDTGSPPTPTADATSVGTDAVANPSAVIHTITPPEPLTETTPATSTRTTSIAEPSPAQTTSGTDNKDSAATKVVTPVTTYRNSTVTGPVTRMTAADGGVFIIPADPTIEQSASQVIQVTTPATLNVQGVDLAGAKKAYEGWLAWGDRALKAPGQDWTAEADKWAMDPVRKEVLEELAGWAAEGRHTEGHSSYFATVSAATPNEVKLDVCNDTSGLDIVNDTTGESVRSSGSFRQMQYVTITRTASGRWLVSHIDGTTEYLPC